MEIKIGFDISEETFSKLTAQEQRLVLFRNIKSTKRFHEAVQYVWLTIITAFLGLFKIV